MWWLDGEDFRKVFWAGSITASCWLVIGLQNGCTLGRFKTGHGDALTVAGLRAPLE